MSRLNPKLAIKCAPSICLVLPTPPAPQQQVINMYSHTQLLHYAGLKSLFRWQTLY